MSTQSLRDVRDHLSEVIDRVEQQHDRVVVTRNGVPAAVILSPDDLAQLEETIDISNYMALDPRLHKLKSQILTDFRNQYRRGLKRLDADIESRDTDLPMLDLSDVPSQ